MALFIRHALWLHEKVPGDNALQQQKRQPSRAPSEHVCHNKYKDQSNQCCVHHTKMQPDQPESVQRMAARTSAKAQ